MAPVLTLHQNDAEQQFEEHPTEVARRALMAAAAVEEGLLALAMRQAAQSLPRRDRLLMVKNGEEA